MKRKSCSFLALFLAFSLISCTNDNSNGSNSIAPEPSTSESSSTKPSTSGSNSSSLLPSASTSASVSKNEFTDAINKAVSKADLIAKGTIKQTEKSDFPDESNESSFEYGKDSNGATFHYNGESYSGAYDMYLLTDTDGSVVAIQKNADGSIKKPYDTFDSIGFPFSNILGYSASFNGVEGLVQGLFTYGETNVNKDFKYQIENGVYSFNFGYFESLDTWEFLKVNCSFEIGTKEEFKSVNVVVESYNQSSFMVDDELGIIQLNSDARASTTKTYEISQTIGDRTFVCPIDLKSLKVTSFDLMYGGSVINSDFVIEVEKKESINISLTNIAPDTASFDFDKPNITISQDGLSLGFSSFNNSINGTAGDVGEYNVEVKTTNVTKTFKVKVIEAQPKSVSLSYFTVAPNGYNAYSLTGNKIDGFTNVEYIIKAGILPDAANQGINASIEGIDASKYELTKKTVKVNDWSDETEMWSFIAKESGDFPITFASAINPNVKEVVTIHISNAPTFAEVLSSKYGIKQGKDVKYELEFNPIGTGENGTVTIQDKTTTQEEVASYTISSGETHYTFNLTHVSGDTLNMQLVMMLDYSLASYNSDWEMYETFSKVTIEFLVAGSMFEGYSDSENHTLTINLMNNNEASLIFDNFSYQNCSFSLIESEDNYLGTFKDTYSDESFVGLPVSFTLSKDMQTLTISFEIDGSMETFILSISE